MLGDEYPPFTVGLRVARIDCDTAYLACVAGPYDQVIRAIFGSVHLGVQGVRPRGRFVDHGRLAGRYLVPVFQLTRQPPRGVPVFQDVAQVRGAGDVAAQLGVGEHVDVDDPPAGRVEHLSVRADDDQVDVEPLRGGRLQFGTEATDRSVRSAMTFRATRTISRGRPEGRSGTTPSVGCHLIAGRLRASLRSPWSGSRCH